MAQQALEILLVNSLSRNGIPLNRQLQSIRSGASCKAVSAQLVVVSLRLHAWLEIVLIISAQKPPIVAQVAVRTVKPASTQLK